MLKCIQDHPITIILFELEEVTVISFQQQDTSWLSKSLLEPRFKNHELRTFNYRLQIAYL